MTNFSAYDAVFGNEALKKAFSGFTEKSAFPNSVIISGRRGSGKLTFARLEAMSVSCRNEKKPCLECESCRKIAADISPDVILVSAQKDRKTIGIEAVRNIRESAYIAPNDLSSKFYIIKDADTMTVQAQNALLKLFEEPPANVYFILLCSSATGLLPTVRSRAPELRTELFGDENMRELLITHSSKAKELYASDRDGFEKVLRLAGGSYGEALRLIGVSDKKMFAFFSSVVRVIDALSRGNRDDFLLAILEEAYTRDNLVRLFELMLAAIRDMTAAKKLRGEFELMFYSDISSARFASAPFTLKGLLDICSVLQEAQAQVSDINVNVQTAALVFADKLWNVK